MDQCIINPIREKGEPSLPPTGVFAVNPADARAFTGLADKYALKRSFLFNSSLYFSDRLFIAGPAIGAPMAVMSLEKLIVLGAKKIIVYGWCGSLQPSLQAGDLLLPDSGLSEEGTSNHYGGTGYLPDERLKRQVEEALRRNNHIGLSGPIWTTDAPYRETREKVKRYQQMGIFGVDMEYTALSAAAAFRRVSLAALMLVSDELYHEHWEPLYRKKQFIRSSASLLGLLCREIDDGGIGE